MANSQGKDIPISPNKEIIDMVTYLESRGLSQSDALDMIVRGQVIEFIKFGRRILSVLSAMV